jgi:nucleoside-diphosphate-sugar epimerase
MRILIAGATGVIGRRLVPLLTQRGHHVTGLIRRPADAAKLDAHGAHAALADVYDTERLHYTVRQAAPDLVMHQLTDLGGGDRQANSAIRRTGTRNLVDAAQAAGVRKMIAQSIAWVYEPGTEPATEDTPLDLARDDSVRAVDMLEKTVSEIPEWVVLRYGLFYGPTTWYAPDGLMAGQARAGKLTANGDITSFLHIDDAAAAAVAALDWPSGPVNVCDDDPAPGTDWLPAFCASVGAPPPPRNTDRNPWARGADSTYARKHLDWTPVHPSWRSAFSRDHHEP